MPSLTIRHICAIVHVMQLKNYTSSEAKLDHLKIGDFSVALFTASVIAELNVPLTRQPVDEARVLKNHCIDDVLQ